MSLGHRSGLVFRVEIKLSAENQPDLQTSRIQNSQQSREISQADFERACERELLADGPA